MWTPAFFGLRGPTMEVRVVLDTAPAIEESGMSHCKLIYTFNTWSKEIMLLTDGNLASPMVTEMKTVWPSK